MVPRNRMPRSRGLAALLAAGLLAAACAQVAPTSGGTPRRLAAGCVELMMPAVCPGVFAESADAAVAGPIAANVARYELACESMKVTVLCGPGPAIEDEIDRMGAQFVSEQQDGPLRRRLLEWDEPGYEGPGRHGLALQLISEPTPADQAESLVMVRYAADAGLEFEARLIIDSIRPRQPRSP